MRKFLFLTILIQGPKQPGIDIDVSLEPLMEEMEKFGNMGLRCGISTEERHSHLRQLSLLPLMITLPYFLCLVRKKENRLCSLFEWYNICVPERISEDSVYGAQTLANKDSQVP
jgi:hypothetical protein